MTKSEMLIESLSRGEDPRSDGKGKSPKYQQSIGIDDLKGYYYMCGVPKQVESYLRTTRKIADYVGITLSKEMWKLVHRLEETDFPEPPEPKDTAKAPVSRIQVEKYRMLFNMKHDKEEKYKKEKGKVFRIVLGQCSDVMRDKVEGLSEFKGMQDSDDVIGLLEKLKGFAYSTQGVQYEYWTMQSAMRNWINLAQEPNESIEKYGQRFIEQTKVTESMWGLIIPWKTNGMDAKEQETAGKKFKACVFLAGVDRRKYRTVIDDLNNDFVKGNMSYPEDVSGMVTLLANRRGETTSRREEDDIKDGVNMNQMSSRKSKNVKCFKCKKRGHYASECPEKEKSDDKQVSGYNGFSVENRQASINEGWLSG
jgi:hypothetical protein